METIRAYASHIISPYHRVGILSFLRYFALPARHVAATVYIESGNWKKSLLPEELIHEDYFSAEFTGDKLTFGPVDLLKAVYALLFMRSKPAPGHLLIGHSRVNLKLLASLFAKGALTRKSRIATVVIDEGIGTYAGFAYRYQAFCRENKPRLSKKLMFCLIYPVNQHLLKSRYIIDYDWRLIRSNTFGRLSLNDIAISRYRDTFLQAGTPDINQGDRPDVLLITQPLVELGLVRLSEYRDILSRLRDMARAAGLSLMVKCHPAEEPALYDKFGFKVTGNSGSAETLISQLQPGLVLGISSTALINSCIMFQIKSHSILKLLPGCGKLGEQLFRDTSIRRIYKEYVHFIDDWSELDEILAQLTQTTLGQDKLKQVN